MNRGLKELGVLIAAGVVASVVIFPTFLALKLGKWEALVMALVLAVVTVAVLESVRRYFKRHKQK